jgi:hypothetical protein
MAVVAGVLGAIVGFVLGIVLVEVIVASHAGWTDVIPFGLAAFGWLVGSSLVRRRRDHAPNPRVARPH